MALKDSEILAILAQERRNALGLGESADLTEQRELALDYFQGHVPDLPHLEGLSKAVSTDVADAVYTALPDLIEIFAAGDNVMEFTPRGQEDEEAQKQEEEAAQQETDYVNHVFWNENPGFELLHTTFQDALVSKTGVFYWFWEEKEEAVETRYEKETLIEFEPVATRIAADEIEVIEGPEFETVLGPAGPVEVVTATVSETKPLGRAKVISVAPEDFFVDRNASSTEDATILGFRQRLPASDLVEMGFDKKKIAKLRSVNVDTDDSERQARDTVDEDTAVHDTMHKATRLVEIIVYQAKLDVDEDDIAETWQIIAGADDNVILEKEEIDEFTFATITPYPVAHRFYGFSVADLLMEVQKVKTALTRGMLDHLYFSVVPRPRVDPDAEYALDDSMTHQPGRPVRAKDGEFEFLNPPSLALNPLDGLEYMSTVGELRSGIARNATGLDANTLQETATKTVSDLSRAQMRIRMIAKIFAEGGLKRMFLGLHRMLTNHASQPQIVRLRGNWAKVDPNHWERRKDMTVNVGLGTGMRDQRAAAYRELLALQTQAVELQGGSANGPLVDLNGVHNSLKGLIKAQDLGSVDQFWRDPAKQGDQQQQTEEPEVDPDVLKVQLEAQRKQAQTEADIALDREKFQFEANLALMKAQAEIGLTAEANATKARINEMLAGAEIARKADDSASENARRDLKADTDITEVRMGGQAG